jgi:hypothetical protein
MLVRAQSDTIWSILLDSVGNPQRYMRDVEESRVLESTEGEIVREIKIKGFVFDRGRLKEIDTSGSEDTPGVVDCVAFERGIIREIVGRGASYKEKILVSDERKEIRHDLIDHPRYAGKIVTKVVPLSVQNPMAPSDLQFFLELESKPPPAEATAGWEEEMVAQIGEELQRLKEKAEELEKNA